MDNPKIFREYYRDNLLAALEAVELAAPGALNTGDWFHEVIYELRDYEADVTGSNVDVDIMAQDLKERVVSRLSDEEVLKLVYERFSPLELLAHAGTDSRVEEKQNDAG